ncbi:hypothetical protein [Geobacter benzoatilyticus]|jgi:hypothetical protein|uniref:Periplasmic heavy metal sensor n=1 Tax=Geobacter benzoatilyticus TaxID=2815309 RepID=A0ABX7Q002_9BACT|nr:hypothetical protein [Geobacter benzoatilyticus]QSV44451.1 hypothetical protein JZM60_09710 [Geobacter benzoatilyticus]
MKRIRFVLTVATVVVAIAGINQASFAQTGPGGGGGMGAKRGAARIQKMDPEQRLKRMGVQLGLNAEQKAKILPILQEQGKEMDTLRADGNLTRTQRQEKMQEIRNRYHERIGEHLTPEQRTKADAMRELAKERWQKRQEMMK